MTFWIFLGEPYTYSLLFYLLNFSTSYLPTLSQFLGPPCSGPQPLSCCFAPSYTTRVEVWLLQAFALTHFLTSSRPSHPLTPTSLSQIHKSTSEVQPRRLLSHTALQVYRSHRHSKPHFKMDSTDPAAPHTEAECEILREIYQEPYQDEDITITHSTQRRRRRSPSPETDRPRRNLRPRLTRPSYVAPDPEEDGDFPPAFGTKINTNTSA